MKYLLKESFQLVNANCLDRRNDVINFSKSTPLVSYLIGEFQTRIYENQTFQNNDIYIYVVNFFIMH